MCMFVSVCVCEGVCMCVSVCVEGWGRQKIGVASSDLILNLIKRSFDLVVGHAYIHFMCKDRYEYVNVYPW